MVLPVKVFNIRGLSGDINTKLSQFHEVERLEEDQIELVSEVLDLESEGMVIRGIFSRDFLKEQVFRREVVKTVVTEEAPFWIVPFNERRFLIVMAPSVARGVKKLLTNHVAVIIGQILDADVREARIPAETLRLLHESNPQATNLIWFDNVDLPGVNKLCLSGEALADTGMYKEYIDHGLIWYVVFTGQEKGYTTGITRNTVITNFSKSTPDEFIQFVREDVLKLIE